MGTTSASLLPLLVAQNKIFTEASKGPLFCFVFSWSKKPQGLIHRDLTNYKKKGFKITVLNTMLWHSKGSLKALSTAHMSVQHYSEQPFSKRYQIMSQNHRKVELEGTSG